MDEWNVTDLAEDSFADSCAMDFTQYTYGFVDGVDKMLEMVCEWIKKNGKNYGRGFRYGDMVDDLKKAYEEDAL